MSLTGLSDHNLITLGVAIPRRAKPESRWESIIDTRKAVDMVNDILSTIDFENTSGYKTFQQVCLHAIAGAGRKRPASRGKQWAKSDDISRLTKARKEYNLAWRKARKESRSGEEARQACRASQDELRKQIATELERKNKNLSNYV